ncbi:hypothetical protein HDU87_006295 [Geranomyces variabilis]|uniref:Glucanase n=1 Tax=Geranomyces variabilis TaxID=109894 RepID=A0AAD5TH89_9FUNG|nr:hypothetical protein HDU87_006295 [Geranomyces variabilis]
MYVRSALLSLSLLAIPALGQQAGTLQPEVHPTLQVSRCTKTGGCQVAQQSVVLDSQWRWLHQAAGGSSTNCYTGSAWNAQFCADGVTCAKNCALEGNNAAQYENTYGITTPAPDALNLRFVTPGQYGTNVGSRVFLLDSTGQRYEQFRLKNREFSFQVDASQLDCGLNGALYFVGIDAAGGKGVGNNNAGAALGTGYGDAQCPHDIKFIAGAANLDGWASTGANTGSGSKGSCAPELDLWEANKWSTAFTAHPCSSTGPTVCTNGQQCGDGADRQNGLCDKDGLDWNSFRMGDETFYGPGKKVDSTRPIQVITQFITADGTDSGDLKEIRRVYVQDGQVIPNSRFGSYDSITDAMGAVQKKLFGDQNTFAAKGGLKAMGQAMDRGMTLAMSLWDDHAAEMLWLDSTYPVGKTGPGAARGSCPTTSGNPADVESQQPNASVKFSGIKWGEIGSTFAGAAAAPAPAPAPPAAPKPAPTKAPAAPKPKATTTRVKGHHKPAAPTPAPANPAPANPAPAPAPPTAGLAPKWGQCGGQGWTGPTRCVAGSTCKVSNPYYSQCL